MKVDIKDIIQPIVARDEKLQLIKDSIQKHGLFHQILLQGDVPYRIVAGKRRVQAFIELGLKEIDAEIVQSENSQEIALHENLRRNNLSWYEQVELEKELHDLRISQHGEKRMGRDWGTNPGWTKEMTAKELGLSMGGFSQDLKLAEALLVNPELRNVKDKATAMRLIKMVVSRSIDEAQALRPPQVEMNKVMLGDSATILKMFPAETFDVCITDPPWSEYKDAGVDQKTLLPVFQEIFRVLKPNSFLYVITSTTDWYFYNSQLQILGFSVQKYPLIWHKPLTITYGRRASEYARDFEPILLAWKGAPSLTGGTERSAVFYHNNVHTSKMIHPHEKPVELIVAIMQDCCYQGSCILDPFAGSGVVGSAAKLTGRNYILIEQDYPTFAKIEERLA